MRQNHKTRAFAGRLGLVVLWLTAFGLNTTLTLAQTGGNLTAPLTANEQCGAGGTPFTLAAVGDFLLHYNIQDTAKAQGYDYIYEKVKPYLAAANFTYGNLEGPIVAGQESGTFPTFAYNPALLGAVKKAEFDIVSTANNHALDRRAEGADSTIAELDKVGILHHGTTARNQKAKPYQPFEMTASHGQSIKAAFISATYGTNGIPDSFGQVNMLWDGNGRVRQAIKDAIAQAKRETELVVIAVHWGDEYQFLPNGQQIQGARELAEAGADVILGDHPHTIQPVDFLDVNGRRVIVIYSLGNFIAAQEGFQSQSYTQTSLIFYVGLVKAADGKVSVTGYQYLPVYIENDTRPVPIFPGQYQTARQHVLQQMRDPSGQYAISPDPQDFGNKPLALCPTYYFAETPDYNIPGDFARYFGTLGSNARYRPLAESIALVGFPTSAVVEELTGDCSRTTSVLYTERQRLELQPDAPWPFRVVGTQLGSEVYLRKYNLPYPNAAAIPRHEDLNNGAIARPEFREFFNAYGGLTVFGYPLSDELTEKDAETGATKTVQYFERARMELIQGQPLDANPLYRVKLGLLSKEYSGIAVQCITASKSPVNRTNITPLTPTATAIPVPPSPTAPLPTPVPVATPRPAVIKASLTTADFQAAWRNVFSVLMQGFS